MSEQNIHCSYCGDSFVYERMYMEHKCLQKEENLLVQVKSEPEEREDLEEESFLQLASDEISGELINIKTENAEEHHEFDEEDDDSLRECDQEDPLSFSNNAEKESDIDGAELETNTSNVTASTGQNDQIEDQGSVSKKKSKTLPYKYLEDYTWQCKLCEKILPSRDKILKHFNETHKTYRPFECSVCGKKFVHKHYVNLHMRVHTGERPYVCQLCPRSYSHKTSFTIHMRIHNGVRPYSCDVCGKKCYDKSGLTSHMRSHTKETPYQCEVCGRRFTHSKSLLVHRRNHTGEKPYVCSYCGKAFRHWHKHKIHVRLHTGERPYKCKVCGKGFPRNDEVSRHMRSHQGIKSFKCSICGVYCATQASITGHINLHHYNLKPETEEPPPEKTLVKDSTSGILGTKAPEPRSLYRLASQITGSGENFIHTPKSRSPRQISPINRRISTRIIEVTSKDTPISIPSSAKKSGSKKINCVLPKQKQSSPSESEENKMSYQEFIKWQERMLANQGLIVKGYSSSTNEKSSITSSSSAATTATVTSTNVAVNNKKTENSVNNKNTQSSISSSQSAPKQQYLLLSQTTDGNSTKILLPLGMIDQSQTGKPVPSLNLPTVLNPNSAAITAGAQGQRPLILLPQAANNQPLLLVSNGGQKMLLMPSQNITKTTHTPISDVKLPNKADVKKELEDSMFAAEMTIKTETTESFSETTPMDFQTSIKIKEEPQSYDEF